MKKIIYFDMPTDFSQFDKEYEFVNTENICPITLDHIFKTGEYMIKNYKYFSIEQWIYNTLYNNNIMHSRAYDLYNKTNINCCINSFLTINKLQMIHKPIEVENTDNTFQKIHKSHTNWLSSNFYNAYKHLIQLKMLYSSFFFSEICEFIECPYVISSNIFFHNFNEFIEFKNKYKIKFKNFDTYEKINFPVDFHRIHIDINLKNFVVYHNELYIRNSICYDSEQVPYGSLYNIVHHNIENEEPSINRISVYIKKRPYTKVYDQYMQDILQLQRPASIHSILSSKVYKNALEDKNEFSIDNDVFRNIYKHNNILMYEKMPIIFYYKSYQITNYKIKFSQQNIYQFWAYHMNKHTIELIKMRKTTSQEYEIIEIIY